MVQPRFKAEVDKIKRDGTLPPGVKASTTAQRNLLSVGGIDFTIIADSAIILVENSFRNCQGSSEAANAAPSGAPTQPRPLTGQPGQPANSRKC
jgi:hypothetical protein